MKDGHAIAFVSSPHVIHIICLTYAGGVSGAEHHWHIYKLIDININPSFPISTKRNGMNIKS
jgi:hypothetical protein